MRVTRSRLRPFDVDGKARVRAKELADRWRSAGLTVDLVEYLGTASEPGGYTITGQVPGSSAVHTASDIPLSAIGAGAGLFTGTMDNTDVFFRAMQAVLGGAQ